MNFKVGINLAAQVCDIFKTGDAIGHNVYGSLKMARAALSDQIDAHIGTMRDAKKAALKVRESDLREDKPSLMAKAVEAA